MPFGRCRQFVVIPDEAQLPAHVGRTVHRVEQHQRAGHAVSAIAALHLLPIERPNRPVPDGSPTTDFDSPRGRMRRRPRRTSSTGQ
jgi:hypothetical protein